ncbi:MAG TPA: hypothetical protein VJ838_14985 [Gaiellaceae bacterium]|nr:hypothetical protein [Gaiellaceae bacterium]
MAAAVLGVVAALLVGVGAAATSINSANAPNGTHFKSGTASCTVTASGVSCSGYTLAGVGNTNATAALTATYTATVVCVNNGDNTSDSQHQGSFTSSTGPVPLHPSKNGNLSVPSLAATAPTAADFLAQQSCPNPNWTPTLGSGITLSSFTYTLTFAGFSSPYITITGP